MEYISPKYRTECYWCTHVHSNIYRICVCVYIYICIVTYFILESVLALAERMGYTCCSKVLL